MSAQDGRALLARIRPTKRKEKIQMCLRPDLLERHAEMETKLAEMTVNPGERLGSGVTAGAKKLAKEILALETEIEAHSVWFTLQQLDGPRWQEILDSNPPRDDFALDMYAGYNRDAVLDQAIHEGLIDPAFEDCDGDMKGPDNKTVDCDHESCGTYQQFRKQTPGGEWAELRSVANLVNSGVVADPKSVLASQILAPRGRGSAPRAVGE